MLIEKGKSLKELTTFRIGGKAQFFCVVEKEEEIQEALSFSNENKLPFFILGGGSNILVSDEGFKGLVMKMEIKGMTFTPNEKKVRVTVQAGEDWDNFVEKTVKKGLFGLENLSLIPGTAGAAAVQNIGAYGSEVRDTIESVRVFDSRLMKFINFSNRECHFAYRDSIFKREAGRYIIISITFILSENGKLNFDYKDVKDYFLSKKIGKPSLADIRKAVIHIRKSKLPDVSLVGTAGSFFKNSVIDHSQARDLSAKYPDLPIYPFNDTHVKISLAWIIDHVCGYKAATKGNVGTYKNQALVIVNNGNATAKEINKFADEIAVAVKQKTGIDIEPEVQFIGSIC